MKKQNTLCIFLISIFSITSFSQEIDIELFASGFDSPVSLKNAGDDRLFVVEQDGVIKIINSDGSVNGVPFMDIDDRVINTGNERGLLGLAFHPQYISNGFFYVNYINNDGDTVVSRFITNPPDGNVADPNTETILLTINQPFSNHNGGDMAFGNDGYLYIATGDGGSGGDPDDNAQDLTTLLGKLLRIDINNAENGNNYAIPDDNPFVGNSTALDEIWAYGLRNPWRFSFDSLTDDLWIGDVGQGAIEEINFTESSSTGGENYGWRCYEGNSTYNTTGCPDMSTLDFPVAQYTHSGSGPFKCSITGGYRYRGTLFPNFIGLYFFADYCSNEIGYLTPNGSDWDLTFSSQFTGNGWTTFGEANNGELYIAGRNSGNVFHIVDPNLSVDEVAKSSFKMYPNPVDDVLVFETTTAVRAIETVTIYDLQGKVVKTIETSSSNRIEINTKNIASGLYLAEISSGTTDKEIKKLIVN